MKAINHSHPLVMQITELQSILTNHNQLIHMVKSQFTHVPDDIVDAVFDAHEHKHDACERAGVQANLVRYATCTINNIKEAI